MKLFFRMPFRAICTIFCIGFLPIFHMATAAPADKDPSFGSPIFGNYAYQGAANRNFNNPLYTRGMGVAGVVHKSDGSMIMVSNEFGNCRNAAPTYYCYQPVLRWVNNSGMTTRELFLVDSELPYFTRSDTPIEIHGIALQGTKILLYGKVGKITTLPFVLRLTEDGRQDTTFNTYGMTDSRQSFWLDADTQYRPIRTYCMPDHPSNFLPTTVGNPERSDSLYEFFYPCTFIKMVADEERIFLMKTSRRRAEYVISAFTANGVYLSQINLPGDFTVPNLTNDFWAVGSLSIVNVNGRKKLLISGGNCGVARLNWDGTVDTTFKMSHSVSATQPHHAACPLPAVPGFGKSRDDTIAIDQINVANNGIYLLNKDKIVKWLPDGSGADTSFGNGTGQVMLPKPNTSDYVDAMKFTRDNNGNIIVVGRIANTINNEFGVHYTNSSLYSNWKMPAFRSYIARFLPNGQIDTSFGNNRNGYWIDEDGFGYNFNTVSIQPDGKIVAAGSCYLQAPTIRHAAGTGGVTTTQSTISPFSMSGLTPLYKASAKDASGSKLSNPKSINSKSLNSGNDWENKNLEACSVRFEGAGVNSSSNMGGLIIDDQEFLFRRVMPSPPRGKWHTMDFKVTLSAPSPYFVRAYFTCADGRARSAFSVSESDYRCENQALQDNAWFPNGVIFRPGETERTISIPVSSRYIIRQGLSYIPNDFSINLHYAENAILVRRTATGTISYQY